MAYLITQDCKGCQACVRNCPTQAITGDHHKLHHIDPQRCIDCGTCGRICPYQAVQTPEGETAQQVRRADWLQPIIHHKACVSCGLCITICPVSCLDLKPPDSRLAAHGTPYLKAPNSCIGCTFCEQVCPVAAIQMLTRAENVVEQ